MYQINRLNRNVLIMPREVVFHADTSELDAKNLWANIVIAEERFIRKMLCRDLYDEFRTKKNMIVTESNIADLQAKVNEGNTGKAIVLKVNDRVNAIELVEGLWYQQLWNEYLGKICAECVLYVSTPSRWLQTKAAGEMHNNPAIMGAESQSSASADLRDVKWKMDKMLMDRIDPLIENMREWLCANKEHFTTFNCVECPRVEDAGTSYKRKTPWIHGIYDKKPKDCSINVWK